MKKVKKSETWDKAHVQLIAQLNYIGTELKAIREDLDRLQHDNFELWRRMMNLEGQNGNGTNNS